MYPNLNTGAIGIQATLAESIALAQEHGFQGIDFSIVEAAGLVEASGLAYVQDLFTSSGVKPGAFGFPVDFRKDEASWRADLEALPKLAELAQRLGCGRTATWIVPTSASLDFRQNFDFHVARLKPAAEILADYGCRFGLEFIGPKTMRPADQHDFIHTMEGMLELAQAIGPTNAGLLLDCWHLYTSHGTAGEVHRLSNEQVVVVHVNDAPAGIPVDEQIDLVRTLPAETGVIDIAAFMAALQAIGYDGPVTAEPFSERVRALPAQEAARQTAESVRRIWPA